MIKKGRSKLRGNVRFIDDDKIYPKFYITNIYSAQKLMQQEQNLSQFKKFYTPVVPFSAKPYFFKKLLQKGVYSFQGYENNFCVIVMILMKIFGFLKMNSPSETFYFSLYLILKIQLTNSFHHHTLPSYLTSIESPLI